MKRKEKYLSFCTRHLGSFTKDLIFILNFVIEKALYATFMTAVNVSQLFHLFLSVISAIFKIDNNVDFSLIFIKSML